MEVEEWNGGERNVEAEEVEDGEREVQHVEQVVEQELPEEDRVTIRLKFLNETQKEVEASLVENLGQFKRRNFTQVILVCQTRLKEFSPPGNRRQQERASDLQRAGAP